MNLFVSLLIIILKLKIIFLFQKILTFMTASLSSFLGSLFVGVLLVIIPITAALIIVSRLDPLSRED